MNPIKTIMRSCFLLLLVLPVLVSCDDDEVKDYPKPEIASVSPEQGLIGTTVTITGKGLKGVTRVEFANIPAAGFDPSANTDNSITVKVPQGLAAGRAEIAVYYPGASENNLGATAHIPFTVLYPPVLSAVTPAEAKPTKTVLITGNYISDATMLKFGETSVMFEVTSTGLSAIVPEIDPGEVQITVITPGGTASLPFVVKAKTPEIVSFDPQEGKPGVQITVTGQFFNNVQEVTVNGAAAQYEVVSPTELVLTIPQGSSSGKIKVTSALGSGESDGSLNVLQALPLPYTIYDEGLNSKWQKWGGWGTSVQELESTEQAKTGSKSIKITYSDAWGGFQLHPTDPDPFALEGATTVKLSIYIGAAGDGKKVMLYIKAKGAGDPPNEHKKTLTLTGGQFTTFEIPLSDLGNPESINEFVLQNHDTANITIYVDEIQLL